MTLQELRAEYGGDVIGRLILQEVEHVVHSPASRYPPEIYARAASWDHAEADVVQGFVLDVLLGEHQLDYVMATALTLDDCCGYYPRSAEQLQAAARRLRRPSRSVGK